MRSGSWSPKGNSFVCSKNWKRQLNFKTDQDNSETSQKKDCAEAHHRLKTRSDAEASHEIGNDARASQTMKQEWCRNIIKKKWQSWRNTSVDSEFDPNFSSEMIREDEVTVTQRTKHKKFWEEDMDWNSKSAMTLMPQTGCEIEKCVQEWWIERTDGTGHSNISEKRICETTHHWSIKAWEEMHMKWQLWKIRSWTLQDCPTHTLKSEFHGIQERKFGEKSQTDSRQLGKWHWWHEQTQWEHN